MGIAIVHRTHVSIAACVVMCHWTPGTNVHTSGTNSKNSGLFRRFWDSWTENYYIKMLCLGYAGGRELRKPPLFTVGGAGYPTFEWRYILMYKSEWAHSVVQLVIFYNKWMSWCLCTWHACALWKIIQCRNSSLHLHKLWAPHFRVAIFTPEMTLKLEVEVGNPGPPPCIKLLLVSVSVIFIYV